MSIISLHYCKESVEDKDRRFFSDTQKPYPNYKETKNLEITNILCWQIYTSIKHIHIKTP